MWFVVMTTIGIVSLVEVSSTTHKIVGTIRPNEKVTIKIVEKLQALHSDILELVRTDDQTVIFKKIKISEARIEDVKEFPYKSGAWWAGKRLLSG